MIVNLGQFQSKTNCKPQMFSMDETGEKNL